MGSKGVESWARCTIFLEQGCDGSEKYEKICAKCEGGAGGRSEGWRKMREKKCIHTVHEEGPEWKEQMWEGQKPTHNMKYKSGFKIEFRVLPLSRPSPFFCARPCAPSPYPIFHPREPLHTAAIVKVHPASDVTQTSIDSKMLCSLLYVFFGKKKKMKQKEEEKG